VVRLPSSAGVSLEADSEMRMRRFKEMAGTGRFELHGSLRSQPRSLYLAHPLRACASRLGCFVGRQSHDSRDHRIYGCRKLVGPSGRF
jgi:hypothetical protein